MRNQILVITSCSELASFLEIRLPEYQYPVTVFQDNFSGMGYASRTKLSLIILADRHIPDSSIADYCHRLHSVQPYTPIIALTQNDDANVRIACLDSGASDCLSEPFQPNELLARIRVHFRSSLANQVQLRYSDLVLDLEQYQVFRGKRIINLTAKEFKLLEYLMQHPKIVLSRDQILENVWGWDYGGMSNIIEVYIRSLRKKLETNHERRLIQTVRYVGYVLRDIGQGYA